MEPILDQDLIDEIFRAAGDTELLGKNRDSLFVGIPPQYKSSIPSVGTDLAQLRVDLGDLNKTRFANGRYPFRTWLRNALLLKEWAPEAEVFAKAITTLDRIVSKPLGGAVSEASAALSLWRPEQIRKLVATGVPARAASVGATMEDPLSLVTAAASNDWLDKLILAALAQQIKDNPGLVALAQQQGLIPKVPIPAGNLQQILRQKVPFQDVGVWNARLARAMPTIARAEMQRNGQWKPAGTAFLVAPDLVMTNYHVVEPLVDEADVTDKLRFRFDFQRTTDGMGFLDGHFASPVAGKDWKVLASPPSEADLHEDAAGVEPSTDELDFALVRLSEPIGDRPIGGAGTPGNKRGWLVPSTDTATSFLGEGENVLILQHPSGAPLSLAFGTFLAVKSRRVRYDTNTEEGSSGSPCFDAALNVVALHHSGDPSFAPLHRTAYNQGIPMHLIAAMCKAAKQITFTPPT